MMVGDEGLDLHGFLRISLVGARPSQVSRLAWELGATPSAADEPAPADVTIQFVDELVPPRGAVRLGGDAADPEAGLFIAAAVGRHTRWMHLEPWTIGSSMTVRCDRRMGRVPHLQDLINIALLVRGTPAVHAASLVWDGRGILAGGWSGGRKTDVLLSLVRAGAEAMADEWTVLRGTPPQMTGLASPVRLVARHLDLLGDATRLPAARRARLLGRTMAADLVRALGRDRGFTQGLERKARGRAHLDISPASIFGERYRAEAHPVGLVALIHPTDDDRASMHPIDSSDLARRLAHVHSDHRSGLTSRLEAFGYVAPDRLSEAARQAIGDEGAVLSRLLTGVPGYMLRVPAAMDAADLARAVRDAMQA